MRMAGLYKEGKKLYLRMLKKDLKDKIGLNIVLCIFMILAATLIVMSAGFIYTFIAGIDDTYEKCNTSDIMFLVDKSVSDEEGQRKVIEDLLMDYGNMAEISPVASRRRESGHCRTPSPYSCVWREYVCRRFRSSGWFCCRWFLSIHR